MIRLTGEKGNVHVEIGATLLLSSIDAALDKEKLEKPEYREAMKLYLFHLKGGKGTVDKVLRKTMKDGLICLFNFDGRKGKRALVKLTLINNILIDVFAPDAAPEKNPGQRVVLDLIRILKGEI